MDISKIKTLIDFVGRSNVTELTVTEKDTTVRIFTTRGSSVDGPSPSDVSAFHTPATDTSPVGITPSNNAPTPVQAPIYGVLHTNPAPGENAFIKPGDTVEAGQTLFIIEAMKVFNAIVAPRAGRILHITAVDGSEVEAGDLLAEIA